MGDKVCKLPPKEELEQLLKDDKNIIWYMRCPEIEGDTAAKRYLKRQIEKFNKERKKKYGGL